MGHSILKRGRGSKCSNPLPVVLRFPMGRSGCPATVAFLSTVVLALAAAAMAAAHRAAARDVSSQATDVAWEETSRAPIRARSPLRGPNCVACRLLIGGQQNPARRGQNRRSPPRETKARVVWLVAGTTRERKDHDERNQTSDPRERSGRFVGVARRWMFSRVAA